MRPITPSRSANLEIKFELPNLFAEISRFELETNRLTVCRDTISPYFHCCLEEFRTLDLRIMSALLHRLSYEAICIGREIRTPNRNLRRILHFHLCYTNILYLVIESNNLQIRVKDLRFRYANKVFWASSRSRTLLSWLQIKYIANNVYEAIAVYKGIEPFSLPWQGKILTVERIDLYFERSIGFEPHLYIGSVAL